MPRPSTTSSASSTISAGEREGDAGADEQRAERQHEQQVAQRPRAAGDEAQRPAGADGERRAGRRAASAVATGCVGDAVADHDIGDHGSNRYPTPRAVVIQRGSSGSASSFWRSRPTCTVTVAGSWYSGAESQTSASSWRRVNTRRGERASVDEEVELLRGQRDEAAVDVDLAGHRVDAQRAVLDDASDAVGGGRRRRAPQHVAHPRRQLARRERLDDVVVGAELEADDAVDLVGAGGEQDHRDVARRRAAGAGSSARRCRAA